MTDLLEYISTWSVLKWVVLVLIAGFIGQFGRMAANAIAARIRLRRQKQESALDAPTKLSGAESSPPIVQPDKKLLKAIAKSKKKEAKKKK